MWPQIKGQNHTAEFKKLNITVLPHSNNIGHDIIYYEFLTWKTANSFLKVDLG